MEEVRSSVVLDWYLGFLHHMLLRSCEMPVWNDIRVTEKVELGDDALPVRLGRLYTVDEYRPRFTELATRGWPWMNVHAVGLLHGVLVIAIELPGYSPTGAKWTAINISGPNNATKARGYILDGLVAGSGEAG